MIVGGYLFCCIMAWLIEVDLEADFAQISIIFSVMTWLYFVHYIVQVSMGYGTITAHALMSLEARGTLFVTPGMEVVSFANLLLFVPVLSNFH